MVSKAEMLTPHPSPVGVAGRSKSAGRGRPRCEAKNTAILESAVDLFMENGFEGTSMDEVARRAGVSKQTVYSHFSGKEQLFSAAVRYRMQDSFAEQALEGIEGAGVEDQIHAISLVYARLLLSQEAISMFRLLVSGAPQGPELARLFWASGPEDMILSLADFLRRRVDEGSLRIDNVDRAANQLIALLQGRYHFLLAIGLIDKVDEDDIRRHAADCTRTFLDLYRA
ncbi:TetR/AcrR family transcriptional regulator [Yunchengibacter salinarum]|uniref:TetR/AcrR family transcriptional regulator n=1 Tax=Yunchengibacter salinarum TaxID=3133399 RepID=UPI0035B595F0